MTPDLRELRYFVAVAEELSFTRAAERLHVSQPALSGAVRQLETRVGVALFRRTTRRVELTAAGQTLLVHARLVLKATESLDGALRVHRSGGRLRIGIFAHGAGNLTIPILTAFRADHPEVEVTVSEVGPSALPAGRVDVVLAPGGVAGDELEIHPLQEDVALVTRQGERDPIVAAFRGVAERVAAEQLHRAAPPALAAAA